MTKRWVGLVIIAAMAGLTLAVYGDLPAEIPTHWNLEGEVDDWSPKVWGAWMAPFIGLGIWALLPVLRKVDPRRRNYDRFDPTFWLIINLVLVLLGAMHVMSLGAALGWPVDIPRLVPGIIGVMFIAMGNYMPRLRSNWWMGIRTPWTLESETVWRATHRLAGFTFVGAGLLMLLSLLLPRDLSFPFAMGAAMVGAFVPVIYSFFRYRREQHAS